MANVVDPADSVNSPEPSVNTPEQPAADDADAPRPQRAKKVNRVTLYETLLNLIEMERGDGSLWPVDFRVYEPEKGRRLPIVVRDREAALTNLDHVADTIMTYARGRSMEQDGGSWLFDAKACLEAAKYWLHGAATVDRLPTVAFADDDGLAWRRLPWARGAEGPTPTWDVFLKHLGTNADALMAWVGSCFFEQSDLSTYLWLYGDGANGKSRFFSFLGKCFGPSFMASDDEAFRSRWWIASAIGKRVICMPDTNSYRVTTSGRFKSITGGDELWAEPKGQPPFKTTLPVRILLGSNNLPDISGERADLRRCILVKMDVIPEAERRPVIEVDAALWGEGAAFVSRCMTAYLEACPAHGEIPFDDDETQIIAADHECEFATVVDHLDTGSPTYRMAGADMLALVRGLKGKSVDFRWMGNLAKYLVRVCGVKKSMTKGRVVYHGVKLNAAGQAARFRPVVGVLTRSEFEAENAPENGSD